MARNLSTAVAILAVLWLIRDLYALESNQTSKDGDLYFDDSANRSSTPAVQPDSSSVTFLRRDTYRSSWSKADEDGVKSEDSENDPGKSDSLLKLPEMIDSLDLNQLLKYVLSLVYILNESDENLSDELKDQSNSGTEDVANDQNKSISPSALSSLTNSTIIRYSNYTDGNKDDEDISESDERDFEDEEDSNNDNDSNDYDSQDANNKNNQEPEKINTMDQVTYPNITVTLSENSPVNENITGLLRKDPVDDNEGLKLGITSSNATVENNIPTFRLFEEEFIDKYINLHQYDQQKEIEKTNNTAQPTITNEEMDKTTANQVPGNELGNKLQDISLITLTNEKQSNSAKTVDENQDSGDNPVTEKQIISQTSVYNIDTKEIPFSPFQNTFLRVDDPFLPNKENEQYRVLYPAPNRQDNVVQFPSQDTYAKSLFQNAPEPFNEPEPFNYQSSFNQEEPVYSFNPGSNSFASEVNPSPQKLPNNVVPLQNSGYGYNQQYDRILAVSVPGDQQNGFQQDIPGTNSFASKLNPSAQQLPSNYLPIQFNGYSYSQQYDRIPAVSEPGNQQNGFQQDVLPQNNPFFQYNLNQDANVLPKSLTNNPSYLTHYKSKLPLHIKRIVKPPIIGSTFSNLPQDKSIFNDKFTNPGLEKEVPLYSSISTEGHINPLNQEIPELANNVNPLKQTNLQGPQNEIRIPSENPTFTRKNSNIAPENYVMQNQIDYSLPQNQFPQVTTASPQSTTEVFIQSNNNSKPESEIQPTNTDRSLPQNEYSNAEIQPSQDIFNSTGPLFQTQFNTEEPSQQDDKTPIPSTNLENVTVATEQSITILNNQPPSLTVYNFSQEMQPIGNSTSLNDNRSSGSSDVGERENEVEYDIPESGDEEESDIVESGDEEESDIVESGDEEESDIVESGDEEESDIVESGDEEESDIVESGEEEESGIVESGNEEESDIVESEQEEDSDIVESGEEEESGSVESGNGEESEIVKSEKEKNSDTDESESEEDSATDKRKIKEESGDNEKSNDDESEYEKEFEELLHILDYMGDMVNNGTTTQPSGSTSAINVDYLTETPTNSTDFSTQSGNVESPIQEETFNSILEYILKFSNNPFFKGMREDQNVTMQ